MKTKRLYKLLAALLCAVTVASCVGCSSGSEPGPASPKETETAQPVKAETDVRPEVFSADEYLLYQNVFYADYGKEIDGDKMEKEGVFTILYDAYKDRQRCYVWGYYDQTKCCDWQWELVPEEGAELPVIGSLVTVTGTFEYNEDALDKYWIKDAHFEVRSTYTGPTAERDMRSMSCTLERVQMINVMNRQDAFQGKTFLAYGRIASLGSLEDPYYNGSWQIDIIWDGEVPAIGTLVELSGTIKDGKLIVSTINET